jgi:hypothetical protein
MVTKQDVENKTNLRFICTINGTTYRARQSGEVKTWKTRPDDFKVPVKYGLYASFYIDNLADGENNAHMWELM